MTKREKEKEKEKEKFYATPSLTVKRIHRNWRHSSANWILMIHSESGVVIRLSVGMHRITAWYKKWNKYDADDEGEYGQEFQTPAKGKKIPLDTVIPHIGGLGISGFACYCNNKALPDCNPLDAAYYVLVVERELHRSTIPWMPMPVMDDIRDVKQSMDHVSGVVDAMDSLRESDPKVAQAHDDSMLERAERRKQQRRLREAIKHVEEEPPEPIQEQDQEPTTEQKEKEVPSGEKPGSTTQSPDKNEKETEEDRRRKALRLELRNQRFSEILKMARNKL